MCLIFANSKYIKIKSLNIFIYITIDNDFVDDPQCTHKFCPFFCRI